MKRNTILLYSLISIAFICSSISSVEVTKNKINNQIMPSVSELTNLVKPMISPTYHPEEVDSLLNEKINSDPLMTKAEIIGSNANNEGLSERPTIYESVINPHAIGIRHSNKLNNIQPAHKRTPIVYSNLHEKVSLPLGQVAVPVEIGSVRLESDKGSNLENPFFLKKDGENKETRIENFLAAAASNDKTRLQNKLFKKKQIKSKVKALYGERRKLKCETQAIRKILKGEISNLSKAKTVGVNLDELLNKYSLKFKKDQMAKLKLVDRVDIKKELKNKIFKEVQGLRIFNTSENLISKVDGKDINNILNQIKTKLGH